VRGYVLTHSVFDILACVRRCLLPAHSSSPSELTFVMYTSSSNLVGALALVSWFAAFQTLLPVV
jgi:hypothetical protein